MSIKQIYEDIDKEREYAYNKWPNDFDEKNTLNDWASYIVVYLGKAVAMPFNKDNTRKQLIKVAGLVINAIDWLDEMPKRHYD